MPRERIAVISNAVVRQRGGKRYFVGEFSSDIARSLTFVPVIEPGANGFVNERQEGGYQRPGSGTRMRAFAQFLAKHPASVVPPVLLSGRGEWRFIDEDGDGVGELHVYDAAAVVDGQHRLGGYIALSEGVIRGLTAENRMVEFLLLESLSVAEERDEFLVVNNSQKGVPKALTSFLEEKEQAQIAWALNTESDSPFLGRISRTTLRSDQLFQLHSVAKEIPSIFKDEKYAALNTEQKIEILIRYWTEISDALPQEWADIEKLDAGSGHTRKDFEYKLLELTGYIAWSRIAPDIFGRAYHPTNGMNWDMVKELVLAAGSIDWTKTGDFEGRTGTAGATAMYREMVQLL